MWLLPLAYSRLQIESCACRIWPKFHIFQVRPSEDVVVQPHRISSRCWARGSMTGDGRDSNEIESPDATSPLEDSGMRLPTRTNQVERANFTLGWCVWAIASSISIVSSKYILLVENYHYPLHLLLLHLLVAALGSTCRTVRYRGSLGIAFSAPGWTVIWKSRKYRGPFEILGIVCTAISLPLAVQAVTHFWNVITLTMICVRSLPCHADVKRKAMTEQPADGFFSYRSDLCAVTCSFDTLCRDGRRYIHESRCWSCSSRR